MRELRCRSCAEEARRQQSLGMVAIFLMFGAMIFAMIWMMAR
jgi:hypothetical protein